MGAVSRSFTTTRMLAGLCRVLVLELSRPSPFTGRPSTVTIVLRCLWGPGVLTVLSPAAVGWEDGDGPRPGF